MSQQRVDWSFARMLAAILLAGVGGFIGIYGMFDGASDVVLPSQYAQSDVAVMIDGLKQYCWTFGFLLLLAGAAYVLIGFNDRTETDLVNPDNNQD